MVEESEKVGGLPIRNESTIPFKDFIYNNGLMDIGFTDQRYTWTNYHIGDGNIKERLDRGLCTQEWRRKFDTAKLFHEPIIGSDHCPLRLELVDKLRRDRAPFWFDRRWYEFTQCDELVINKWNKDMPFQNNLIKLQKDLSKWSKENVH
ncbi:hypothetical protein LINPERHAP2_LOCUS13107 [Linum perenne]